MHYCVSDHSSVYVRLASRAALSIFGDGIINPLKDWIPPIGIRLVSYWPVARFRLNPWCLLVLIEALQ